MLPVLQEVQRKHPDLCRITEVHDVPYARYQQLMDDADVQLDQLYSYTPSMNSLLAMAKGVTVVGGGEPENYEILNETELRPPLSMSCLMNRIFTRNWKRLFFIKNVFRNCRRKV